MSDVGRPQTQRRRWLLISGVMVVAALAVAGWFTLQGTKQTAPAAAAASAPPPAVGVRATSLRGVSRSFEFVGRAKAVNKVEVRARIEGFLDKVLFTEGQDVKAGDLLYRIEKVQFQSALDQPRQPMPSRSTNDSSTW